MDSTVYRRGADGRHTAINEDAASVDEFNDLFEIPSAQSNTPQTFEPEHEPKISVDRIKPIRVPKVKIPKVKNPKVKNPKKSGPIRRTLLGLKIIVVAYLVFYIFLGVTTSGNLQKTRATPNKQIADTAGQNWLLVGSDSRKGLSFQDMKLLRTGMDNSSQRTDSIMIVHFGGTGKASLVSLPRDSLITLPEHLYGKSLIPARTEKINAAYSFGGAPLLVKTVEQNTGLHIDHYMEVGFGGIRDLTDAVGGVRMCVPRRYLDADSGLDVQKGCQNMDGKTALAYVRMRHADPLGDLGRIQRQQQYLGAVLQKVITPSVLLNPFAMNNLSKATTKALVVGRKDSVTDIGKLGLAMRSLMKGKGAVKTVPIASNSYFVNGVSYVLWNRDQAKALFKKLGAK